jgi:prefoldin subunit 5
MKQLDMQKRNLSKQIDQANNQIERLGSDNSELQRVKKLLEEELRKNPKTIIK